MERGTRERLVVATSELLRRKGYAATGIKEILTAAGAPSGSMYHFFPGGKEDLAAEAIRMSGKAYRDLVIALVPADSPFDQAVSEAFTGAGELLASTDFVEACPIAAIALETTSHSEPLRLAASAAFDSWLEVLTDRGEHSGLAHDDAAALAETILMLLEGAFLLARTRRDVGPLATAGNAAAEAVRSQLAHVGSGVL